MHVARFDHMHDQLRALSSRDLRMIHFRRSLDAPRQPQAKANVRRLQKTKKWPWEVYPFSSIDINIGGFWELFDVRLEHTEKC